jgi:hypothetical protein
LRARLFVGIAMRGWGLAFLATFGALIAMGCGRDARLTGHKIRDVTVGPVAAYDRTLDKDASPRDVVFVLLKAIVDDYDAGHDKSKREAALDTQFAVCAPDRIVEARLKAGGQSESAFDEQERNETVFRAVYHWAPIVGHYCESFRADYATLSDRMLVKPNPVDPNEVRVLLNVHHPDPKQSPNADAVAEIALTKQNGFWRIWWVGWEPGMRDWTQSPLARSRSE